VSALIFPTHPPFNLRVTDQLLQNQVDSLKSRMSSAESRLTVLEDRMDEAERQIYLIWIEIRKLWQEIYDIWGSDGKVAPDHDITHIWEKIEELGVEISNLWSKLADVEGELKVITTQLGGSGGEGYFLEFVDSMSHFGATTMIFEAPDNGVVFVRADKSDSKGWIILDPTPPRHDTEVPYGTRIGQLGILYNPDSAGADGVDNSRGGSFPVCKGHRYGVNAQGVQVWFQPL